MNFFSKTTRLIHISYILLKHGLDEIVLAMHLFRPLRFLVYLSPARWAGTHSKPRGVRIREALEELGPIFVKFGQVLSTRFDILPEDIVQELILLQDQVPPFPGSYAKQTIETALGSPLSEIFQEFEMIPLASASIAQVHAATLLNGQAVVVKVLRPNVHVMISKDIELLRDIARLANRYWKAIRRFKPREIVFEFEKALFNELDLNREAANASQLRRNFKDSKLLYIPEIYWPYTKNNILVMERIYGISISNLEHLKQQGFDLTILAKQMLEVFFTQVFRDSFFHADMHPGNILVETLDPKNPTLIAVDFGIVGSLNPADQRYLAENILAFINRDYRRVAELHIESGWVPPFTRLDEFESAIRAVSEPVFERPLKDISFGELLFRLFQTAERYQVNIQPQLILLQKTLLNIEGLSRRLAPDIDLWHTIKPFLEEWLHNQMGFSAFVRKVKTRSPYWLEKLPELPQLVYDALQQLAHLKTPSQTAYGHKHPSAHTHTSGGGYSDFSMSLPPLQPQGHALTKKSSSIKYIFIGILLGVGLSYLWTIFRK